MRTLALVPARGGSRRVPGKNLTVLGGRTLVRRALETSVAAGCFDEVALSSEDERILEQAEGLDDVVAVRRPVELAADTARSLDAVLHALGQRGAERFDAVAIVQATSPFTAPEDLRATVALLAETPEADSAVSAMRVEAALHPLKLKVLDGDRLSPWLAEDAMAPSHQLPALYVRNGSVYVTRRAVLERGEIVGPDCRAHVMPAERSHDVDTPQDLAFAQWLLDTGRVA